MQTNLPSRLAKRQGNNTAAPAKPATAAKPAQAEARTMSQKPMSSEKPDKAPKIQSVFGKDCAILLGESLTPVVVAKALDKNSLISAKLRILRPQDCDPFLGYTIEVDLEDQARNEALGFGVRYDCRRAELDVEVATKHVINVKFPRDITIVVEDARQALPNYSEIFSGSKYSEAAVVHITIPENSDELTVEGFGLPFSDQKNPQLEGWLHGNQPIAAGLSLVDLVRQKKMSFFVDLSVHVINKKFFEQPLPEPFKLPYQTVGAKFEDYREPVKMHQGHQFMPRFVLDSDDDHNIVVNHAVVQDMLWIYEAAHEIKRMKRPVYFAALDKPSADREKKFYVIVSLLDDFRAAYGDAWRRLTRYFGRVEVSFYDSETSSSDPCEEWDGTIIENPESIPRFVECHKPDAEKELVMLIEPSKRPCKKSALIRRQVFENRSAANRAMRDGGQ